jgi:hypothetical protein
VHLHLLACVASRKRIRARPNRSRARPVFSELGIGLRDRREWARRAFVAIVAGRVPLHISSRNRRLYPVRSWARWRFGRFAAAGTATAVMALRRTKAPWAGHQSVQRTVIKLPIRRPSRPKDGQPSAEKCTPRCAPGPACLRSEAAIAAGQIEGKAVDQFRFLGKITAEIRGRATRTERELNVD